jgi:hypothetical protein
VLEDETFEEFGYYSSELDVESRKPVKAICVDCNLKHYRKMRDINRFHKCALIIDGKKRCFSCKTRLDVEEFSKSRNSPSGYAKQCRKCYANYPCVIRNYKKKSERLKTDIVAYFKQRVNGLRSTAKKKNLDFDLDYRYLLDLYESQDRKCYYTGEEIVHNEGVFQMNSISIDRLNPSEGYVKGNVTMCSFAVNSFKNNLNICEFKEYLKTILPNLTKFAESDNVGS